MKLLLYTIIHDYFPCTGQETATLLPGFCPHKYSAAWRTSSVRIPVFCRQKNKHGNTHSDSKLHCCVCKAEQKKRFRDWFALLKEQTEQHAAHAGR